MYGGGEVVSCWGMGLGYCDGLGLGREVKRERGPLLGSFGDPVGGGC